MKLATKERYALGLMLELAKHTDEFVSLTTISTHQAISVASLRPVAQALIRAGLIETGGEPDRYRLAGRPEQIRLITLFGATDGRFACTDCTETEPEKCRRYRVCANVHFWEGLSETDWPAQVKNMTLKEALAHVVYPAYVKTTG